MHIQSKPALPGRTSALSWFCFHAAQTDPGLLQPWGQWQLFAGAEAGAVSAWPETRSQEAAACPAEIISTFVSFWLQCLF